MYNRGMKNPVNNTRRRDVKFKFNTKDKLNASVDEMFKNSEIVAMAYQSEIGSPHKKHNQKQTTVK